MCAWVWECSWPSVPLVRLKRPAKSRPAFMWRRLCSCWLPGCLIRELFDLGMGGSFYAQVVKVPEEYPAEDLSTVLLYEPEEAAKIFAQLCGYTLLDKNGRVITGRMPGQEEQK